VSYQITAQSRPPHCRDADIEPAGLLLRIAGDSDSKSSRSANYEQYENASKRKAKGLTDLLDYYALIDDGILLLSNGSFLAAWEVRGPDMDALTIHHSWSITAHLARQLSLGTGWTLQADQIRAEYQEYSPERPWPDPVSH